MQLANNTTAFIGGGQTFSVGSTEIVTGFDPSRDRLDLGTDSIHNQIGVDTAEGFAMLHMFDSSKSMLLEGVYLKDLTAANFTPIADAHLQQDLSAALAFENGTGLVRDNTIYVRSHEAGLQEIVDFNPATDKISMFYLSVRGDQELNFSVEETAEGVRFYSPITGQSITLRDTGLSGLTSDHFEWRANQLEDNVAGRMALADKIEGFTYQNIYSGKSVEMAGLVDRAPYHSQPEYTGTPIGGGSTGGETDDSGSTGDTGGNNDGTPIVVTVTGGSVTEGDPGMPHMHDDGTSHVHDDGHKYIIFSVSLDAPASEALTLSYTTVDGLAVADTTNSTAWDYHETTGTLVFAPGEQTKTVPVAVHPDTLVELTETFTFQVSGDNITGDLVATGIIFDNDVTDPDGGGDMDGGMDDDMGGTDDSVVFDTGNQWSGGFIAEATFTPEAATNGWTITFTSPAEISNIWNAEIVSKEGNVYTIQNAPYNSDVAAGQEVSFGFQGVGNDTTISNVMVNGETVGDGGGHMDGGDMGAGDTPPINVTVTGGSVTESDPGMTHMHDDGTSHVHDDGHRYIVFEVSLDAPASDTITLTYATADGTAVADTSNGTEWDYHEKTGTLIFAPGEQIKTVEVAVHPDTLVEGDETFILSVAGDNIAGTLTATGTIIDNDTADAGGGGDMGGDDGGDSGMSGSAVSFDTGNQWDGGFVADATFTPDVATNGWTITFTSTAEITNIWNAEIVSKEGDVYTIQNVAYNGDLAAGEEVSFGFQASGNDATISNIMVDGEPVGTGGDDTGGDTGEDTGGDAGGDTGGDSGGDTGGDATPGGGDILNGPLSTVGTDIVDADGVKVDLKGVNWFGFETETGSPHGLWARNMEQMLDEIADFGFNMIRLPYAGQLAFEDTIATGINTGENPALAGMTSLEIMGEFLDAAAERGLGVLLDMHRQTPGAGPEAGGRLVDVQDFMDQWAIIAERFGDHPAVIGFDLLNEPHGYTWEEWAPIAEQVGNMLLETHPDELIIVEGVETYQGDSHWWGGNLQGVADRPIVLNADDKLVYSPHEYATSVFEQPYFTEAGYDPETTLPQIFSENWGFIEEQGIAPVLLGEFGSTFESQIDKEWGPVLTEYLLENDIDWAIWSWNPNSGDTQGVVLDDWETPREDAFTYLLDDLLAEDNTSASAPANMQEVEAPDTTMDVMMPVEDELSF